MSEKLKVYMYNRNKDIFGPLDEKDLIAEIKPFDNCMDSVLSINGKLYSPCCARKEGDKYTLIQVKEIEIDTEENENYNETNIKCPICGSENSDSWEISYNFQDDYECSVCHSILYWEREIEVTYSAKVVQIGEVLTPEVLEVKTS